MTTYGCSPLVCEPMYVHILKVSILLMTNQKSQYYWLLGQNELLKCFYNDILFVYTFFTEKHLFEREEGAYFRGIYQRSPVSPPIEYNEFFQAVK